MKIDYVRVYQKAGEEPKVTCDPSDYPTKNVSVLFARKWELDYADLYCKLLVHRQSPRDLRQSELHW